MSDTCDVHEFGPFRLDASRRLLTNAGTPVSLSSRAFDILQMLVEERGRVLTKDEIMSRVWRGTIVEENNLAVQISALRRALGERLDGAPLIVTVPGQGYRFVAPVTPRPEPPRAQPADPPAISPAVFELSSPVPVARTGERARPRTWMAFGACGIAAIVLGAALVGRYTPGQRAPGEPPVRALAQAPPPRLSIVVLPFRNLGEDRHDDYLADALGDDLTTDLSHLPGSVVIARASADSYKGRNVPTDQIGRALNVRYVLEGSLRSADGMLAINAQLIEAATGGHLWAERFEVPRAHIGEAQEAAVRRIASALGVTLVQIEGAQAGRKRPNDQDALDLFFRARSILDNTDTLDGMTDAQHLLEQAIAKQPDFADALGALAWLLLRKVNGFDGPHNHDDLDEARQTVTRLLALAPRSAEALAAHGFLQLTDAELEAAEASYEAALAADPNSLSALTGLAQCQARLGRFESAAASLQSLLQRDPEGPRSRTRFYQLGFANLMLGRPGEAIAWLHRSTAGDPDPAPGADANGRVEWSHIALVAAYALGGDLPRARAAYATYAAVWPHRTAWHLAAFTSETVARLPAFQKFQHALTTAGMPEFADEHADDGHADDGRPQTPLPTAHGNFDPTPPAIPGIATIDTRALAAMLAGAAPPVVIDLGRGAAAPPPARVTRLDPLHRVDVMQLAQEYVTGPGMSVARPVVVMGDSSYGWTSYDAALQFRAAGVRNLLWYRGGEEAWAKAGMPAADRRAP